jgi:hypothetical protein
MDLSSSSSAPAPIRAHLMAAARYWERHRLGYNVVLSAVALTSILATWLHFRAGLHAEVPAPAPGFSAARKRRLLRSLFRGLTPAKIGVRGSLAAFPVGLVVARNALCGATRMVLDRGRDLS